jgi:flagellar motor switch protein FliG
MALETQTTTQQPPVSTEHLLLEAPSAEAREYSTLDSSLTANMDGLRKVAVLLVSLGDQASAAIAKELSEDELQRISKAIAMMPPISSDVSQSVLREFQQLALARTYVVKGGLDYASRMLQNAFGTDFTRRLLDRVTQSIGNDMASFDSLQKAEPQQLANFVHNEHPQTIALILSHLNPSQAAALLAALPPQMRSDLAKRMANLDQISPEIIARIAHVIGDKLKTIGDLSRESYGGVRAVAEMLNRLDANVRNDILTQIASEDENLVETIRRLMFVFEDLLTIDSAGIKEIIGAVDRRVLTAALKGTSERLMQHIIMNLSQSGAEMLQEDVEALGPVKIRDVESAQQEIIAVARTLEAKGVLSLSGAPNDRYVV